LRQKKKFIGDTEFAKELKFLSNVIEILEKSNNETKAHHWNLNVMKLKAGLIHFRNTIELLNYQKMFLN
jgi:hypothetical protein